MAQKSKSTFSLKVTDLIPGLQSLVNRLPTIAKAGLSTLTLFNELPYSLGSVLEYNAKKYHSKKALLFEEQSYTYAEFNSIVNQYSHYFKSIGVKHGTVVVVFLENRPETIIITAALAKIGAIASLINPNQRNEILLHSLKIKQDNYFVIDEALADAFDKVKDKISNLNQYLLVVRDKETQSLNEHYLDLSAAVKDMPDKNPNSTRKIKTKDHLAYIFTSGTTGMPKASVQTHKQWLRSMNWFGNINADFTEKDTIYVSIPFFHANAFMIGWGSAFANGSTIAMRQKFSSTEFWNDIKKFNATSFIYIGEICRYLMNAPTSELDRQNKVTKIIGNGMRPEIWNNFKSRFGIENIYEFYAASDSNVMFTNTFNIDNCVGWSPTSIAIVKYDVDNDEVFKNSKGQLERVKTGEVGLMISEITSLFPFAGYANASNNESKIFRNVFSKGDEWYNTGDLMRDIGFKHAQFVDRVGDTFRWKGENVSTAEIEDIIGNFKFIKSVAVYGVQIPNCDGRAGMAAIVLNAKIDSIDLEQFYDQLKDNLPIYAIPVFIRICNRLEVTHTQKIKKAGLKKEGFDKRLINDNILIVLNKSNTYISLNEDLYYKISAGELQF